LTCSSCGKESQILSSFIYQEHELNLCPECYEPYYYELDKRIRVEPIQPKEPKILKLKHPNYKNKDGEEIDIIVEMKE